MLTTGLRNGFRSRVAGGLAAVAIALAPGVAVAESDAATIGTDLGLGVASMFSSLLYGPVKVVYATGGCIVGGFAWMFSGGDNETALTVITPAVRGDYVVTPAVLRGERSLEFYGRAPGYGQEQLAKAPDW